MSDDYIDIAISTVDDIFQIILCRNKMYLQMTILKQKYLTIVLKYGI